jgi:uncharacterized protein YecE (DUF72 family)
LLRIGTAGWTIPRADADLFPREGSSLERYASRFSAVEINSSFHRSHRASTWERWRDSVPAHFRFSVKLTKLITHQRKLVDCDALLSEFLEEANVLGDKLAVLLVQLPPKLSFEAAVAGQFFDALNQQTQAAITCEPRHPSWFTQEADDLLVSLRVARVAADPAICESASRPGGWLGINYWRLHGSPQIYRSSYSDRIPSYRDRIADAAAESSDTWCIFDNTASSAATSDALALMDAFESDEQGLN